ncbi:MULTISPECIES: sugar ABC transporter permease [Paenibacillus]|uniref:Sugar ABC transporter permease n=1 Tax=Paenibacillus glycanilyticus TaxID=126569 RepID=A0ABQ6NHF9_9BACL|nr:sugar ABC transporter permease [Paenibacillus glycanilyticus]MCK9858723.1 sugar ABC transporter permease [Paenibacillus sp. ATY16]GMK44148.1 sugar ABC transporter permease [Paenibacillus glycanilyticus]
MKRKSWIQKQGWIGYAFVLPNMLGIVAFFILPALYSFFMMFTDYQFANPNWKFTGMDNINRLFGDDQFYASLKHTAIFLFSVPVSLGLAFLVALVLNRSVYLKGLLRGMFFLPYISSGVAVAFVWMLLFQPSQGPINEVLRFIGIVSPPGWFADTSSAMYAIDVIQIWFMLGYNMIIYLAALQEISTEQLEAARIDGAGSATITWRIVWPLVSPTTFMLLITGLIMTVKSFSLIQAITGGGPSGSTTILSLFVYKTAFSYYEMGYASTISWFLFAFILIITIIQWVGQKRWVHY